MRKSLGCTDITTRKMVIAVDFDGTCVTHEFPRIGKNIGAAPVLRCLAENGHNIILYTMRSHLDDTTNHAHNSLHGDKVDNDTLQEAIDWFKTNGIPLYGINENPSQRRWTSSPKIYAQIYIDDANLGVPLVVAGHERPYVDWVRILPMLLDMKLITLEQFVDLDNEVQKEREQL